MIRASDLNRYMHAHAHADPTHTHGGAVYHTYESQLGINVRVDAARAWNSTRSCGHNGARNARNIPYELFLVIIDMKLLMHV